MSHHGDRLTDRAVLSATGPGFVVDDNGLSLQIRSTGGKRWIYRRQMGLRRRDMG